MLLGVVGEDTGFNAVSKTGEFLADAAQVAQLLFGKVKGHDNGQLCRQRHGSDMGYGMSRAHEKAPPTGRAGNGLGRSFSKPLTAYSITSRLGHSSQQRVGLGYHVLHREAKLLQADRARSRGAEAVDRHGVAIEAGVFVPAKGAGGFHHQALAH